MHSHKKLPILILLFIVALALGACSRKNPPHCTEYERFLKEFTDFAFEKYDLQLSGEGGRFLLQINKTSIDLFYPDNLSENESVNLLKKITADFHKKINSDINIRPYLKTYPFPLQDINIALAFLEIPGKILGVSYINSNLLIFTSYTNGLKTETLKHFYIYKKKALSEYKRQVELSYNK
jgi:hypothetical protein